MLGLMQDWPLLLHKIIDHAALQYGDREVVTRSVEGPIHRTNYRQMRGRALQRGAALDEGRRQARRPRRHARLEHLASFRSLVRHLRHRRDLSHVNPRLFPEQIAWIVNHAEDRVMMLDLTFVPLWKRSPTSSDDRALRRADRPRAYAGDQAPERRGLRGMDRRSRRRFQMGRVRREHRLPGSATPRARRAIRRACSIRTAPTCCTR